MGSKKVKPSAGIVGSKREKCQHEKREKRYQQ